MPTLRSKTLTHKPTKKGRYSGIKAKYWDYLSDYIRMRDFLEYGTCITCGKKFSSWNDGSQAGHFIAAGNCGFDLLFDKKNINAECQYDNAWNSNHQITMRANLARRYGEDYVVALEERYKDNHFRGKTTKEWTKREYAIYLELLKEEVEELAKRIKGGTIKRG